MVKHLQRELEKIKKRILSLGALVEEQVRMAITAIENKDVEIAQKIKDLDIEIDEMEVEIEEECLKILALHQPVAVDLRFIITTIKINNDLERIGDEMVNIAQRVEAISRLKEINFSYDYSHMAQKAEKMLKLSLDALVNLDIDLAFKVVTLDDEVDEIRNKAYDEIKSAIPKNPKDTGYLYNLLLISRHLERMADHAENIAEDVIYLIDGSIIRHRGFGE